MVLTLNNPTQYAAAAAATNPRYARRVEQETEMKNWIHVACRSGLGTHAEPLILLQRPQRADAFKPQRQVSNSEGRTRGDGTPVI